MHRQIRLSLPKKQTTYSSTCSLKISQLAVFWNFTLGMTLSLTALSPYGCMLWAKSFNLAFCQNVRNLHKSHRILDLLKKPRKSKIISKRPLSKARIKNHLKQNQVLSYVDLCGLHILQLKHCLAASPELPPLSDSNRLQRMNETVLGISMLTTDPRISSRYLEN